MKTRSKTLWPRLGSAVVFALLLLAAFECGGPTQAPQEATPSPVIEPTPTSEGSVRVSPASAVAGEYGTWTVAYTAGPRGVAEGGGVRVQLPASWHAVGRNSGHRLQASAPSEENFVAARCSNPDVEVEAIVELESGETLGKTVRPSDLTGRAGYYEFVTRAIVRRGRLEPGDVLSIVYGETSGGSPGMRVGFRASTNQPVTLAADAEGKGRFRLHSDRQELRIEPGPAVDLRLTARSQIAVGQTAPVHVAVLDEYANPAKGFSGPIEVQIPGGSFRETLDIPAGRGWAELEYTPREPGLVRFEAYEPTRSLAGRSNPMEVLAEAPREPIYWGDLHSHTRFSSADGVGAPEDAYVYARRISGLDFYAMTDHSGGDCENLRERLCPDEWDDYLALADRFDAPGAFAALQAYEASFGAPFGHHNVYFRDRPGPLLDPDQVSLPELWNALTAGEALTIPHHTMKMPEVVDWSQADDPELRRNFEIYSAHGLSEAYDQTHPLAFEQSLFTNPSTTTRTGMSAQRAWTEGYELSAIASSDDHRAQPGQPHFGLTAVRASELSRGGVFQALYDRQTYATTGERILLDFAINDVGMGGRVQGARN